MKIDYSKNPREEWDKNPDYIQLLRETMKQPHMEAAINLLMFEGLAPAPCKTFQEHGEAHLRQEGYFQFLLNLNGLGIHKQEKEVAAEPPPFEHMQREYLEQEQ